ncbi:hypothetical protein GUJ93_ZPchr0003g17429 [Zizania palustris]|uniref:Uncharacterized protein n=1 Tax=Zizania palustris TaxID=103762 RepID=A0A8J5SAF8_ZIZPA|nr:hypothetical protein GUJ93_ZPchr0003g17429 [Zizania palustris]
MDMCAMDMFAEMLSAAADLCFEYATSLFCHVTFFLLLLSHSLTLLANRRRPRMSPSPSSRPSPATRAATRPHLYHTSHCPCPRAGAAISPTLPAVEALETLLSLIPTIAEVSLPHWGAESQGLWGLQGRWCRRARAGVEARTAGGARVMDTRPTVAAHMAGGGVGCGSTGDDT